MRPREQVLEVWGELACFTRPEFKVERFSYPIITPSAARGIFDAIYCKPSRHGGCAEFRWQVTRVEVLRNPDDPPPENELSQSWEPTYIALRRNETKEKAPSDRTIEAWARGTQDPVPIFADADENDRGRTQRQTMALKNVRYRLHAEIRPWPGFEDRQQAFEAQFRRRAEHGKCIYQPYFGCREFPAYFELVEVDAPAAPRVPWTQDLGLMLYDVFDLSRPGTWNDAPSISLFQARVQDGVMIVPPYDSDQVLKAEAGEAPC